MVDPADFRRAVRRGRRGASKHLVVHYATDQSGREPLVGFVAPKRELSRAVDRNLVRRRLRHLMCSRLRQLPAGAVLVVRIRRSARQASFSQLADSLGKALHRAGFIGERSGVVASSSSESGRCNG